MERFYVAEKSDIQELKNKTKKLMKQILISSKKESW